MISRWNTLKEKIEDKRYLNSLSYKRKHELLICADQLSDKELKKFSSIETGYKIARKRYLETNFDKDVIDTQRIHVRYGDLDNNE